jgi:xylan 1,4-beta-xylosidase
MLLSHHCKTYASSNLAGFNVENASDENIKTSWCAQTGNTGEWLMFDLGKTQKIFSLQINFGEEGTMQDLAGGRKASVYGQYSIEISNDSINWTMLIDKRTNMKDAPHDYIELEFPVEARFLKLNNFKVAGDGKFCVRDLRIFGNPQDFKLTEIKDFSVFRDPNDRRNAKISWPYSTDFTGYIIKYGIEPEKLYNNYVVYDTNSFNIHSLNNEAEYYFMIEGF